MGVVLYHIFSRDRDEFTQNLDEARGLLDGMVADARHDLSKDVHLHVEEYASQEDYEADRVATEDCLMWFPGLEVTA